MDVNLKDLRIGNTILCNNEEIEVCINDFGMWEDNESEYFLYGSAITEDYLIKVGFEKLGHKMSNCNVYIRGYWRVASDDFINYSLWHERISPPTWSLVEFEYKHELQNIYYALTGRELVIK